MVVRSIDNMATPVFILACHEQADKNSLREFFSARRMVEAGGIEPPSRYISAEASTCVVLHLGLGSADSEGQDSANPSLNYGFAEDAPSGRIRPACYCRPSKPRRQDPADVTASYAARA